MPDADPQHPYADKRMFYACGPGDVVASFQDWKSGKVTPSETSQTFSSQIFEFARRHRVRSLIVSSASRTAQDADELIEVRNVPKIGLGPGAVRYHRQMWDYAHTLRDIARPLDPDIIFADSGTTHYFLLPRIAPRAAVVPSLVNSLWPDGYPPTSAPARVLRVLDGRFWRSHAAATLCLSPACARQATMLAGGAPRGPAIVYRPIFHVELFANRARPGWDPSGPFRVVYAGRIERFKGVFDVVTMAEGLQQQLGQRVLWEFCGGGSAEKELAQRVEQSPARDQIAIRGKLDRYQLAEAYARAHAVIVPTRSTFVEGLAMVAIEAALCKRPVITCPVVPAWEVLGDAALVAKTNDPASYAAILHRLATDRAAYDRAVLACEGLASQFQDPWKNGLSGAIEQAFAAAFPRR